MRSALRYVSFFLCDYFASILYNGILKLKCKTKKIHKNPALVAGFAFSIKKPLDSFTTEIVVKNCYLEG